MVGTLGGITVTVPTMLFWYVPTGLAEALFTVSLVLSISRVSPTKLHDLGMLYNSKKSK
jgi:ABC-type Co2+ transport system permease subunit